jgi:hypothetical protein
MSLSLSLVCPVGCLKAGPAVFVGVRFSLYLPGKEHPFRSCFSSFLPTYPLRGHRLPQRCSLFLFFFNSHSPRLRLGILFFFSLSRCLCLYLCTPVGSPRHAPPSTSLALSACHCRCLRRQHPCSWHRVLCPNRDQGPPSGCQAKRRTGSRPPSVLPRSTRRAAASRDSARRQQSGLLCQLSGPLRQQYLSCQR